MSFKGEQSENSPNMQKEGGTLELGPSLEAMGNLSDGEKLAMVKSALHSGDHLLKVLFRIALVVDPEELGTCAEWLNSLHSLSSQSPSS